MQLDDITMHEETAGSLPVVRTFTCDILPYNMDSIRTSSIGFGWYSLCNTYAQSGLHSSIDLLMGSIHGAQVGVLNTGTDYPVHKKDIAVGQGISSGDRWIRSWLQRVGPCDQLGQGVGRRDAYGSTPC
jgi:hypothetical protein